MTLSLTPIDMPAHGAKTLSLPHGDKLMQGNARGPVLPSDRLRADSFGKVFALSDVPDPTKAGPVILSNQVTGLDANTTSQDEVNVDTLDFTDPELPQNVDIPVPPENVGSDTDFTSPQPPETEQDKDLPSIERHQPTIGNTAGVGYTTKTSNDLAEMPDHTYAKMPQTGMAKQDNEPKTQVAALPKAAQAMDFDQAVLHGTSVPVLSEKSPELARNQTSLKVTVAPETVKSAQPTDDAAPLAEQTRGVTPEARVKGGGQAPNTALPAEPGRLGATSDLAQYDKPGQSVTVAVPPSEQSPGTTSELRVAADSPARRSAQTAEPSHFWRRSDRTPQPGLVKDERGVTAPAVAGIARGEGLTETMDQFRHSQPNDQFALRVGALVDAAKPGEKQARTASGLIAPAVMPDGAYSKPLQAPPVIFAPLSTATDSPVSIEETSLLRVGFQPDIGAVADQRTISDVFQASRSDGPGRADLPRHVATQLAEAVQRGAGQDRPIELTLNPAELGRVRISMAPGDGTIIVTVLAERGETLDLMRRHADQLAQEFHDLGYGSAEFTFGQNSGDQKSDQGEAVAGVMLPSDDTAAPSDALPNPIKLSTDRIDIRL